LILEDHKNGVSWRQTLSNLLSREQTIELPTHRASASVGTYDLTYSEWFGGQKWPGGLSASGRGMMLDHAVLRRNARTAVHETPQARAIVGRFTDHIVDTGIILNPQPMGSVLGITEERARDWGDQVARRFHLWAMSKKVTRSETENFYQAQRMATLAQQRDNDYFVRLYYNGSRGLQNPLQLQFIDADQINGYGWTTTYGVELQDDGIVRDAAGREIAYKIQIRQPDGTYRNYTVPAIGPRSGRRFMLHGYQAEYPGQGRGFTRFAHAIQEFENLTDFTSAQIKKAINQSNFALKVVPSKENVASNPVENLVSQYAGPASSAYGAEPTPPSGETALPLSELVKYVPLPEATDRVPGSVGVFNLQQGENFEPIGSTAPSDDYDKFVDAFTAHLAASVGMPIEVLLMRFNQNYSASRATLVLFWRIAQIWRAELDADFNNPIYEMWLAGEIAARRIDAPGWTDPVMRAAWLNAQWEGAPMPEIDPFRQSRANKNNAEIGAIDLDAVARSVSSSDGRVNRAKLQKQYQELPLAPWAQKQGGGE